MRPRQPLQMRPAVVTVRTDGAGRVWPVRFWLGPRRLEVLETEDRWYDPRYSYYRVFADDARSYILRRDAEGERWGAAPLGDRSGI